MYDPNNVFDADYRVNPETGEPERAPSRRPGWWRRLLAPLLVLVGLLSKAKVLLVPLKLLKSGPFLGPSISALVSIGAYALAFGWQFGLGLVGLIFVHEMGHVVMLRRYGVRATAPIFVPFLGAFIGMRQLPKNAVMEAYVGLGGPILGTLGAVAAWGLYLISGHPIWLVLTYVGVLLNLFNLLPVLPLDGGRAVAAISRWMWLVGLVILAGLIFLRPNPILILVVLFGAGELVQAWRRRRTDPEYYQVSLSQRLTISSIYFGLAAGLALALVKLELLVHLYRPM